MTTDATYTIKGLKIHDTHDGYAFTARLYLDDKCIGSVENSGTGGSNTYDLDRVQRDELHDFAVYMGCEGLGERFNYAEAEDEFIDGLIEAYETTRWLNRNAANKVLFLLDGDDASQPRYLKTGKTTDAVMSKAIAQLKLKYPDQPVRVYFRGIEAWGLI